VNDAHSLHGVIHWYQFLPAVNLVRFVNFDGEENEEWWINKANGSTKVALIAMDRSLIAWGRMKEMFPEKTESIQLIIAHLEKLRDLAERECPGARSFIRPGLDEVSDYVM
jgi:hypothetical protein